MELKPCPFCGSEAEMAVEKRTQATRVTTWYRPICPECQCDLGYFDSKDEAVEIWNRRVHGN